MLSSHDCLRCLQDLWRRTCCPVLSQTFVEMGDHIVLDRDVRDWVLVPLTMSIMLMMLIRQYATQVRPSMNGWPKQCTVLPEACMMC